MPELSHQFGHANGYYRHFCIEKGTLCPGKGLIINSAVKICVIINHMLSKTYSNRNQFRHHCVMKMNCVVDILNPIISPSAASSKWIVSFKSILSLFCLREAFWHWLSHWHGFHHQFCHEHRFHHECLHDESSALNLPWAGVSPDSVPDSCEGFKQSAWRAAPSIGRLHLVLAASDLSWLPSLVPRRPW
jgi:hypothetical protein